MPFGSDLEVQNRLQNSAPLTRQEVADMFQWLRTLGEGHIRIVWAHLALLTMQSMDDNKEAIRTFDNSSTKLTKRIYWLTWALVGLTVVLAVFTILLWWRSA